MFGKSRLFVLSTIFAAFLFSACSSASYSGKGCVSISLPAVSDYFGARYAKSDVTSFTIELLDSAGSSIKSDSGLQSGGTYTISDLLPGNYTVVIKAYKDSEAADSILIASGKTDVEIIAGETTSASVLLRFEAEPEKIPDDSIDDEKGDEKQDEDQEVEKETEDQVTVEDGNVKIVISEPTPSDLKTAINTDIINTIVFTVTETESSDIYLWVLDDEIIGEVRVLYSPSYTLDYSELEEGEHSFMVLVERNGGNDIYSKYWTFTVTKN